MKKTQSLFKFLILPILFICFIQASAQKSIVSGPMIGYSEHQSVLIWIELSKEVKSICVEYKIENSKDKFLTKCYEGELGKEFNPVKIELNQLKFNTNYEYRLIINGKPSADNATYSFKTKKVWGYWSNEKPEEFSFMVGSCTYLNDSMYDRPGKPYGQSPEIFKSMSNVNTAFMLWSGDNVYLREADWSSEWGIKRRYSVNRANENLQKLLSSRANYAIWDDHDFGPNDGNSSYELKEVTRKTFVDYWGNRTFGENNQGIYSKFNYADCEFFMLDNRFFRSANELKDSLNGKPNPEKVMFGKQQMQWLKNGMISSYAKFKFIVMGGQALNPIADKECLKRYPAEYYELLDFISDNKIEGVIFITGDRHFTELLTVQYKENYPLYEFTCSPLTSGAYTNLSKTPEFTNPSRVEGTLVLENNFGVVSISGDKKNRMIQIAVYSATGNELWKKEIKEEELKYKRK